MYMFLKKKGGGGQKGGAIFEYEDIKQLLMNTFLIGCHIAVFVYLFSYKNLYNIVYYGFMVLIIISFFTCIFMFLNSLNPIGSIVLGITTTSSSNIGSVIAFLLLCSGILQFVSTTLVFTVLNSKAPPTNKFTMTTQNSFNLFMYEIFYLSTYGVSILYFIIMAFFTSIKDGNIQGYEILLGLSIAISLVLIILVVYMFYYAYQLYYNVIIKKNQLYQGDNNGNATVGPLGPPNVGGLPPPPPSTTPPVTTRPKTKTPEPTCY